MTPTGISNQKVDKKSTIYEHRWQPFVGAGSSNTTTKGVTLPAGNYEWPFELLLPGDMAESVEGLREGSIVYKLKATVARGKLAYDLHAYKRLRIIRTLESSALEFLHAMSVENIWPNKIEYCIMVPQKAVVFGSSIPLETRFSPLLKGLELGDITIRLVEVHDLILHSPTGNPLREYRKEREVSYWTIPITREEHWRDMIEDTGQEGWVMNTPLDLPRTLGKCLQDVNAHGIKIRHKLKIVVALKNPDGHVSELRATLPVTIFISPNMPLDEAGNLVRQVPQGTSTEEIGAIAPPSYSEHVLDQLYEDLELPGLQTPGTQSGVTSPTFGHSRSSSAENLTALAMTAMTITPAMLSSRLQGMPVDPSQRNGSWNSLSAGGSNSTGRSGGTTPYSAVDSANSSAPPSAPLSRQTSAERPAGCDLSLEINHNPPTYETAVKTPARPLDTAQALSLPDYRTAASSAPSSPGVDVPSTDPIDAVVVPVVEPVSPSSRRSLVAGRRRQFSIGFWHHGDSDDHRRLHLLQTRERVA